MTASLPRLPTVARMIDELDGSYPGMSLLEIVTQHMTWELSRTSTDIYGSRYFFKGRGDSLTGEFSSYVRGNPLEKRGLLSDSELSIQIAETKSRNLTIVTRPGNAFGGSLTRISVESDYFLFPVAGYPHEVEKSGKAREVMQVYIVQQNLLPGYAFLLEGIVGGRIFLAYMALELYIAFGDLTAALDVSSFSMPDFSRKMEEAIRNTGWGD